MTSCIHHLKPFEHMIMDDFFPEEMALQLEQDFPPYHDPAWYVYRNVLESKKTLNLWHMFPTETYKAFQTMCGFKPGDNSVADYGLHGGGWHMHANGGNLNPHIDYELHPKMPMYRKWNLIVYLSSDYKKEYGGELGLWENAESARCGYPPATVIFPKFNRGVMFDTVGSVHGLVTPIACPEGVYRKSLAVYYLHTKGTGARTKALFYPRPGQMDDAEVAALIERRSGGAYV